MGYEMNEHLVTPTQFGIPNDRARYYLSVNINKIMIKLIKINIYFIKNNFLNEKLKIK